VEISEAINNAIKKLERAKRMRERGQEKYIIGTGKRLIPQTLVIGLKRMGKSEADIVAEFKKRNRTIDIETVRRWENAPSKQVIRRKNLETLRQVYNEYSTKNPLSRNIV
jgi:hypothetical protein